MILLKANEELKKVFLSLIKTLGTNVVWNHMFVITNNTIILPGKVRSLFFDYDTKRVYSNIIELDLKQDQVIEIINDKLLINTINMTLYIFGKWGVIPGLKVEEDYAHLNHLFQNILKEINIEPSFRNDNCRFYKKKILISYEDVIQEVLNLSNPKQEQTEENIENEENKESEETQISKDNPKSRWKSMDDSDEEEKKYKLGLWHKMQWTSQNYSFKKAEHNEEDENTRLGNSFYPVDYKCPSCNEKLYISLYPVNKEFLIETDEGRVYLARVYTCNQCNCFYTPRPDKLLQEGEIYYLGFDEDRVAYEDYLELMGSKGERCANYKFNEYELQHNKKKEKELHIESLEETCRHLDSMTEEELSNIEDKMLSGFYPHADVKSYYPRLKEEKDKKGREKKKKVNSLTTQKLDIRNHDTKEETLSSKQSVSLQQDYSKKDPNELKSMLLKMSQESNEEDRETIEEIKKQLSQKLVQKFDPHMSVINRMSPKQLKDLKLKIASEQAIELEDKKPYLEKIDQALYESQEKAWKQKAESCKGKSYQEINRMLKELQESELTDSMKKPITDTLLKHRKKSGEKEVEVLMSKLPTQLNKRDFDQLMEKLHQYKDVDISPYENQLEQRRDLVEQQEIKTMIARANKRDRKSLYQLYNNLKEQAFSEKNIKPYLDKIHNKIYEMDEKAIQKICPNIMELSFEEGLKAMEEVQNGAFLPELKTNALELLDKRLTKMKVDECDQLARKLKKEISAHVQDLSRLHFYDARKAMRGELEEEEAKVIERALNSYASAKGQYEYPILIGDSSRSANGKEGFVLTPDQIFYNGLFHSGTVAINKIDHIEAKNKVISKGIVIKKETKEKIKLPISINAKECKEFAKAMDDFIKYLQEKPESRSISYLSKEKHEKICCIRCGHVYIGGNICPKCGSKANK